MGMNLEKVKTMKKILKKPLRWSQFAFEIVSANFPLYLVLCPWQIFRRLLEFQYWSFGNCLHLI